MDLGFCVSQVLGRDQRLCSKEMAEDKLMKGLFLSSVNESQRGVMETPAYLNTSDNNPRHDWRTVCLVTPVLLPSYSQSPGGQSHTLSPRIPLGPIRTRTRASKQEVL